VLGGQFQHFGLDGLVFDLFVGHGTSVVAQIGNCATDSCTDKGFFYYRLSGNSPLVIFVMSYSLVSANWNG